MKSAASAEEYFFQKVKSPKQREPIKLRWCLLGVFLLALGVHYLLLEVGELKYVVVFDAGSTGSRVHIFHFRQTPSSPLPQLLGEEFHQVEPGLSSYATSPISAAASLEELLKLAVSAVPSSKRASTPCVLRATAGLRQLEGTQSDDILAAVLKLLEGSPFVVTSDSVSILDGQDEGAFAWLTLNYLKENLGQGPSETATTIDLGGGSVQVAYAVEDASMNSQFPDYFRKVRGGGVDYGVYVHSYLGFGLMAARAAILEANADANTCLPMGFSAQYSHDDTEYLAQPAIGGPSGSQCRDSAVEVVEPKTACGASPDQCSFHGAWGGPGLPTDRDTYLFSYFWDRALMVGMVKQGAMDSVATINEYSAASNLLCTMGLDQINAEFTRAGDDVAPYLCMDLSYCSSLLSDGLGLSDSLEVTLIKQVSYKGQPYEIAWALGAAINVLG